MIDKAAIPVKTAATQERVKQNSRPEHTTSCPWRHLTPRAQKGHTLGLLGNLVAPLSQPHKQQTAPPSVTRDLGARLEDFRRRLCVALCQALHENLRFSGPSSAHFICNDHHRGSPSRPTVLGTFLRLRMCLRDRLWCAANTNVASRINCTPPKGDAFCNHLQPARIHVPCAMSKSLTMTLMDTLAPPSRQIWATTHSTAQPLLMSTPTLPHAAL